MMQKLYTTSILFVFSIQTSFGFTVHQGVVTPSLRIQRMELHATDEERVSNWGLNTQPFTTSDSGLRYLDINVGDGDSPNEGDLIAVHYSGWYDDFANNDENNSKIANVGVLFDDSRGRGPEPTKWRYGKVPVIPGWEEALKTMKLGGKREIIVPPSLGYGDKDVQSPGQPSIPANSHLRFIIELVEVDNSILTKIRMMIPKPSTLLDKPLF